MAQFQEKFIFSGHKISDDLFFSHRPGSSSFPFLFPHIFRMFTMLNVVYDHFLTRKTPFFTLFILSRTSDNTASQNFWGYCPPQSPPRSPPLFPRTLLGFDAALVNRLEATFMPWCTELLSRALE